MPGFVIMPMLGWLILGSIVSFNSKSELIVPQLLFVISYLLTYFLVCDMVLANPKAFFVNGEPSDTLSLHYSYYVYALTEFGLVVMLLLLLITINCGKEGSLLRVFWR